MTRNNYFDISTLDRNRERTVVFYGRVSTEHEAQLSALENQMQWYSDQAKYHPNWNVIDKYIDEGITGTQAKKRPSFLKMIEDAKSGKFDLIVTREVCRFARNTVDTLNFTRELKNIGVEVFFVDDNIWTMDGDGELRLSLMATLAQEESRKVSERVKAGQRISRENGVLYGSGNILGYDRKLGKTYTINPEQAETVRIIFELYSQGYGEKKVADELLKLHRKAADGTYRWNAGKVGRILKNATYMGYNCYNKSRSNNYLEQKRIKNLDSDSYVYVKGDFEPIVSEELWHKCDEIRKSKVIKKENNGVVTTYGKRNSTDIWLKKMKCSCGANFRKNKWRKNKRGDSAYGYQCYNQLNYGSKSFREKNGLDTEGYCDIKMVSDWKLDLMAKTVLSEIWQNRKEDVLDAFEMVKKYATASKSESKTSDTEVDIKIEKLRNRLENLVEMRADGEITKESFAASTAKAEAEIAELEKMKATATTEAEPLPEINLDVIKSKLDTIIDFSEPTITEDIIDLCISSVKPVDDNRFEWTVKLSDEKESNIICSVSGRKTNPAAEIEGESPLTYQICFINFGAIKNTAQGGALHRQLLVIGINQKIAIQWDFPITYEMARAYQKANGKYLRQNQWEDITLVMSLELGK